MYRNRKLNEDPLKELKQKVRTQKVKTRVRQLKILKKQDILTIPWNKNYIRVSQKKKKRFKRTVKEDLG